MQPGGPVSAPHPCDPTAQPPAFSGGPAAAPHPSARRGSCRARVMTSPWPGTILPTCVSDRPVRSTCYGQANTALYAQGWWSGGQGRKDSVCTPGHRGVHTWSQGRAQLLSCQDPARMQVWEPKSGVQISLQSLGAVTLGWTLFCSKG